MAPTRILFCEGNVDGTIGGSYFSLLYLAENVDRSRYDPVVVFHRNHALEPAFAKAGLPVEIIPRPTPVQLGLRDCPIVRRHAVLRTPIALTQSVTNFARFWGYVARLATLLRGRDIGLVHLNNSVTSNHHWMLAAMLARIPCVTHERGINGTFTSMARWLAPRLDAIICISRAVRENLVDSRVARENLHVIHNGLDPRKVVPRRSAEDMRRAYGIGPERRILGMVGNIKFWKGQEVVIRALPTVIAHHPDVICLLVGAASEPDREYEQKLHALVSEFGLDRHVIFTGPTSNVADFLNIMEVAIHASVWPEPFGRVLLEAMALKKPIVGSRAGAVVEIVVDSSTGLTFEPGNAEDLAGRVVQLLDDPGTARAFGEAGYQRLLSQFHISHNVERTMAAYESVLAARR